ncbi:hypothetical protein I4U23_005409 [Adineta vaga]|nr:hypothetical protein I4U23_005409 [Adineta vaga]
MCRAAYLELREMTNYSSIFDGLARVELFLHTEVCVGQNISEKGAGGTMCDAAAYLPEDATSQGTVSEHDFSIDPGRDCAAYLKYVDAFEPDPEGAGVDQHRVGTGSNYVWYGNVIPKYSIGYAAFDDTETGIGHPTVSNYGEVGSSSQIRTSNGVNPRQKLSQRSLFGEKLLPLLSCGEIYDQIFKTTATGEVEIHMILFVRIDSPEKSLRCSIRGPSSEPPITL